ncbi:MAG: DUF1259 domain-containing protein [Gemmatimonadota bacterium]
MRRGARPHGYGNGVPHSGCGLGQRPHHQGLHGARTWGGDHDGHPVLPALGYGTPINSRVADDRVVATGDFAGLGTALDPLLDAMARHGIVATALHSHLIDESPHIYYVHFWADGAPGDVLLGLRAAMDAVR